MKHWIWIVPLILLIGQELISQPAPDSGFSPYVDKDGGITRPNGYRAAWTHLGTYFVSGESRRDDRLHVVYTRPGDAKEFKRTGGWPDGAVIVKEVMHTESGQLTTGDASWVSKPDVWFVMVKDRKGRFTDNPLWGDGWGWALFKSGAPDTQAAGSYKADCLSCHLPARRTDFVYLQGYPEIRGSHPPVGGGGGSRRMGARMNVDLSSGSAERGATVFKNTCSFCHTLASDKEKIGPGLAIISREGKLPSGKDASPESLLHQINTGGNGMPSFVRALPADQKADVIAYVLQPK